MIKRFTHTHDKPVKPMSKVQKIYRDRVAQKFKNNEYRLEKVDTCFCGNKNFDLFSERERYGLRMETVICTACGIIAQSPRLTHNDLVDFYKNYFRGFYMPDPSPEKLFQSQIYSGKRILNYLSQSDIQLSQNAKVLDAGCGPGGMLQGFIDKGYQCTGCDYTNNQIQYGKSKGLNLFSGGIEEISKKYLDYFDLVMLNDVLEHLLDPVAMLNDIHRVLKTDGVIYVQFPGNRSIPDSQYPDMLRLLQLAHTYYFDLKQLQYIFCLAGYKMVIGNESLQRVFRKGSQEEVSRDKRILAKELQSYSNDIYKFIYKCEKRRLFLFLKNNIGLLFKNPKAFLGQSFIFLRYSIFN